jgi:hypothetical protein
VNTDGAVDGDSATPVDAPGDDPADDVAADMANDAPSPPPDGADDATPPTTDATSDPAAPSDSAGDGALSGFPGSALVDSNQGAMINGWIGTPAQLWTLCYSTALHTRSAVTFHTNCETSKASPCPSLGSAT